MCSVCMSVDLPPPRLACCLNCFFFGGGEWSGAESDRGVAFAVCLEGLVDLRCACCLCFFGYLYVALPRENKHTHPPRSPVAFFVAEKGREGE